MYKKRTMLWLLILSLLLLAGCGGSYAQVNLQEPVTIPEDGIISESIVKQLREETAIGTFQGSSNGYDYEWTIFGSDITEPCQLDLAVEIEQAEEGVRVMFSQQQPFGFPALLSIHLADRWETQGATAYQGDKAVYSVSLTGSRGTILNLSVRDTLGECIILPDKAQEEILLQSPADAGAESSAGSDYLSAVTDSSTRVYSDGSATVQDQYLTNPVPAGKPMPVEPENQQVNTGNAYTCTFSIDCATILNNLDMLDVDKLEMVPSNGIILATTTVTFYEGESVFDVLQRICQERGIHMEAEWTPIYNSAYVEGIHNLYEFSCGDLSGWMYQVNGWYPNYGCSRYQLQPGDVVQWRYTCDLGEDVGGAYAVTG